MDILINESTFSSIFWTAVTFGLLMAILGVYAWPRILAALEKREQRIAGEFLRAEQLRKEAEAELAKYREQMARAQEDAGKIVESGKAEAEAAKARYLEEQRREAELLRKRVLREVAQAKEEAVEDLRREAVALSLAIASRLIEKNLTEADHQALIEKALSESQGALRPRDN
jgi:F-type H+-transporting ATPase subunit b